MKMRKKLAFMLAIVLTVAMFSACGSGTSSDTPGSSAPSPATTDGASDVAETVGDRSKTFNIVTGDAVIGVDPHNVDAIADEYCMRLCYEALVDTDHAGNNIPDLAESWELNADCTVLTFKLREGVKFQNGEDFNADVVMYNINRLVERIDELAVPVLYFPTLTGGTKTDEYTVSMNFSAPYPNVMNYIHFFLQIPPAQHTAEGDDMFYEMRHSGTGPWILDEWVSGQSVHYTKNPDYWNKAEYDPYFEDGYVRFVTEPSSAATAHVNGDADAYIAFGGITPDVLPVYAGSEDRIDVVTIPDYSYHIDLRIGFPEGTPFYDEKAREALDLAIDRQLISETIYGGSGVPNGIMPKGVLGYIEDLPAYEYDPERARQLLEESEYDGRELYLLGCIAFPPKAMDVNLALESMLEEVGFVVRAGVEDLPTYDAEQRKGTWDLMIASNYFVNSDPYLFINSRFVTDYMHSNHAGPDAEALRQLCLDSNVATDPAERLAILQDINRFNKEYHGPAFALSGAPGLYMTTKGITGVAVTSGGYPKITYIDWDPALAAA